MVLLRLVLLRLVLAVPLLVGLVESPALLGPPE